MKKDLSYGTYGWGKMMNTQENNEY